MVYHALQHPLYRDIKPLCVSTRWIPNGVSTTWKPRSRWCGRCASAENRYRSGCLDIEKEILRIEKACGREPGSPACWRRLNLRWALPAQWKSLRFRAFDRYRPRCRRLCAQPGTERSPEGTELLFARCSILQPRALRVFRRSIPSIPTLTTNWIPARSRPHQTAGL